MSRFLARSLLAALLLAASFVPYRPAASAPVGQGTAPNSLVQALSAQAGGDLRIGYHRGTGLVNFIGGTPSQPAYRAPASAAALSAEAGAQAFLASYGSLFGLTDPAQQLTVMRDRGLDDGRSFVRFQQQHNGVPILGGEVIVGMDGAKNVVSASGEALGAADLAVATQPTLAAAAAQQIAIDRIAAVHGINAADLHATAPELWLYNPVLLRSDQTGPTRLVWRMDVSLVGLSDIRELVLVDAASGKLALHFNQVDTAMNRNTYTTNHGTTLPGTLLCNQANNTCAGDPHAAAAHLHAGQTYNFYLSYHGRDSINGAGMTLVSTVHYGASYNNAGWTGTQMIYGDAAGYPLADDVVAHELTHGVTDYESNLYYFYQSGAINESLSDIWGEFVDQTNGTGSDEPDDAWFLGEDVTGLGALRNLQNPPEYDDPDKMSSDLYHLERTDNGGVHINSGINNKAATLMVDGGSFNGIEVDANGLTKTVKIYYEVQTNLLTSGSDYLDLYNALFQGCINLYQSGTTVAVDCLAVRDATDAVEMNAEPTPGFNPEAAMCTVGGTVPAMNYYNGFELANAGVTTGAGPGTNRWNLISEYAHGGLKAFYGHNDEPYLTGTSSWFAINPNITLPADAFLHFSHAHLFEYFEAGPDPDYYDGGILEYSINGGGSWTNVSSNPALTMTGSHTGTIASGFFNPLANQTGFVADSHGYYSTRVDLADLAGQAVRFRWRMGLDESWGGLGWFVDDVRIYRCAVPLPDVAYVPIIKR